VCMLFVQINLGRTIAEKFGSSGKMCLGSAAFRNDYLTDVATGSDKSPVKAQKRCVYYCVPYGFCCCLETAV
jgi:hypothetical protein